MSINTIQLKPQMLADFYKDNLIETFESPAAIATNESTDLLQPLETLLPTETIATAVPEKMEGQYFGGNAKQILIIVSHASLPFLPDNELQFLTNILIACKLSVADVAIINLDKTDEAALKKIIETEGKTVLLFGVDPLSIGLPISFPAFQLQKFDSRIYLHGPDLSELEKEETLRRKLWTNLKNLFDIK